MPDGRGCTFCIDAPALDFDGCQVCGYGLPEAPTPLPMRSNLWWAIRLAAGRPLLSDSDEDRRIFAAGRPSAQEAEGGMSDWQSRIPDDVRRRVGATMRDLCPECGTLTVKVVGMDDRLVPPAPVKRCTTCGVEVVDLTEPDDLDGKDEERRADG